MRTRYAAGVVPDKVMRVDDEALGEFEREQQQLKQNIEISTRLIGEAQRRMDRSRALTGEAALDQEQGGKSANAP